MKTIKITKENLINKYLENIAIENMVTVSQLNRFIELAKIGFDLEVMASACYDAPVFIEII